MTRTERELQRIENRKNLARTLGVDVEDEPLRIQETRKRTPRQHQAEVDELAAAVLKSWPLEKPGTVN